MKKSLIFWFAAVTCAALFLVGCESPTDGAAGAAGRIGDGHVGGEVSVAGLQAMIDRYDGTGAELVLDNVEITGTGGVVDFKSVKAYVVGPLELASLGVIINARTATVAFDDTGTITGDITNVIIGSPAVFTSAKVPVVPVAAPVGSEADVANVVGTVTAVENLTLSAAATSIPAGLTVYVYGNLTVGENSVAPAQGKVVPIGTVTLAKAAIDTQLADATYVDVSKAREIVIADSVAGHAVALTLPATVAPGGPDFILSHQQAVLTIDDTTTAFTARIRGNGKLVLEGALTTVGIIADGDVDFNSAASIAFAAGSSVTAGTIFFKEGFTTPGGSGTVTLSGDVVVSTGETIAFGHDDGTLTLAEGATLAIGAAASPTPILKAASELEVDAGSTTALTLMGGDVGVATAGIEFDGDVVFYGDLTLTAQPATFGGTAFFANGKKLSLSANASVVTLAVGGGLAVGTPVAGVPHVYNTVLHADTQTTLTPAISAALDLTFDATNKGIVQSSTAAHDLALAGTATLITGSYRVDTADSKKGQLTVAADGVLTLGGGILAKEGLPAAQAAALVLTGAATNPAELVLKGKSGSSGAKLVVDPAQMETFTQQSTVTLTDADGTAATKAVVTGTGKVIQGTATTGPTPLGTITADSSATNDTTIKGPGAGNNSAISKGWKVETSS